MKETEKKIKFDEFLESIGGLLNGFYDNSPAIKSSDFFEVGDGWLPLVQELIEKLIAAGWNKQTCQVKSKFAGLRFYINDGNDEVHKIISEHEEKSYILCEVCGKQGSLYTTGRWLYTSYAEHAPKNSKPYRLIYGRLM